jgi:hypothetical protein
MMTSSPGLMKASIETMMPSLAPAMTMDWVFHLLLRLCRLWSGCRWPCAGRAFPGSGRSAPLLAQGLDGRFLDVGGGIEVGPAYLPVDHIPAGRFQLLDLVENLPYSGKRNLPQPFGHEDSGLNGAALSLFCMGFSLFMLAHYELGIFRRIDMGFHDHRPIGLEALQEGFSVLFRGIGAKDGTPKI